MFTNNMAYRRMFSMISCVEKNIGIPRVGLYWSQSATFTKMKRSSYLILYLYLMQSAISVKVKVVMHSEQEDSKIEDDEPWERKKVTMMPFLKKSHKHTEEKAIQYEDEKAATTEKHRTLHPNQVIFPLIYRQSHINSMFKFGENWYTWSTDKRSDGSKLTSYYICYDEPKHCDEIGWDRTDALPKCAFQIDSLMPEDRACINSFGIEPHTGGTCDGGEQMKVSDMVKACGPRIRSLWRFIRVGPRPTNAAKPADVNTLICEDEEECFVTIEYRVHHDRITFSLHEPTRGQTFKSALKREVATEDENKINAVTEGNPRVVVHKSKKIREEPRTKKSRSKSKTRTEGKGIVKDKNESGYVSRRTVKNKIKIREDISDDLSE